MKPNFHIDETANFSCTSCGKCCSSNFEIPVEAEVADRILNSGSNLILEKEGYIPLQMIDDGEFSLSHQEDGVCHFYQNELCELHRSHSLSHKPVVCQVFPYTFVNTRQGIFVSLLYSCPAVVLGTGAGEAEQRESLTELFELHKGVVPQISVPDSPVQVTAAQSISWPEYMEFEQQFLDCISGSDPVGSLLKMVETLLPGAVNTELRNQLLEVAQLVGSNLSVDDYEMADLQILLPTTAIERDSIQRFIAHQIHGKLLLVGTTLVSQLLAYAVGIAVLLDFLEQKKKLRPILDFSFDDLYDAFALLEEQLLWQSGEFEQLFLDWEQRLTSL